MGERKLKVFGGCYDGRNRLIVAAPTKRAAYDAMRGTDRFFSGYHSWNEYTCETGNDEELDVATAEPLAVFSQDIRGYGKPFIRLAPLPSEKEEAKP